MPPSSAGFAAKEDAGLSPELLDKFYQVKSDLTKFTPEELTAWRTGVEALATSVAPPTPERLAQYEAAKAAARRNRARGGGQRQGLSELGVAGAGQYGPLVGPGLVAAEGAGLLRHPRDGQAGA